MRQARLHVVCGGGTGALLLRRLHKLGYRLSAGPLSDLDDDTRIAAELGVEVVLVPPAGVPRTDDVRRLRQLLDDADAVILTPFAVGTGNLGSLKAATELPDETPLYLVVGGEFALRDYTGGEATRVYERLRARAVALPRSLHDLVPLLVARFPVS